MGVESLKMPKDVNDFFGKNQLRATWEAEGGSRSKGYYGGYEMWVWAGGRQWWQERQTDKRRQRVMLSQWVGEPASPGSPGHPAFRDEMLERFDLLGDRLSRNEDLARRAWRHCT